MLLYLCRCEILNFLRFVLQGNVAFMLSSTCSHSVWPFDCGPFLIRDNYLGYTRFQLHEVGDWNHVGFVGQYEIESRCWPFRGRCYQVHGCILYSLKFLKLCSAVRRMICLKLHALPCSVVQRVVCIDVGCDWGWGDSVHCGSSARVVSGQNFKFIGLATVAVEVSTEPKKTCTSASVV